MLKFHVIHSIANKSELTLSNFSNVIFLKVYYQKFSIVMYNMLKLHSKQSNALNKSEINLSCQSFVIDFKRLKLLIIKIYYYYVYSVCYRLYYFSCIPI